MSDLIKLYSYWRSSAAYRVRIALHLKELPYEYLPVSLIADGGQHHAAEYHKLNPQDLVPVIIDGERVVRQSMAIIEYLDETYHTSGYVLMPPSARERARVRAISQLIACDIHPLNNLRVLSYLEREFGATLAQKEAWIRNWVTQGFTALEDLLQRNPGTGDFCEGDDPSLADCCLVPQVYAARRYGFEVEKYPTVKRVYDRCMELDEFERAQPELQPDAVL